MAEKLFRTTLVASPEEVREAQQELDRRLDGILETFSDVPNFEYLLKHKSAANSDVYLISRPYTELGIAQDRSGRIRSQDSLSLRLLTEAATRDRNVKPVILNYDLFPAESDRYGADGTITPIPAREDGEIYSPSFYSSLARLLNNPKFREAIRTRDSLILGDVESDSSSILTFNPARIRTQKISLI